MMSSLVSFVLLSVLLASTSAKSRHSADEEIDLLIDELMATYGRGKASGRSLQQVASLPGHKDLMGVAHLGSKIYVAQFGSNSIQVYDDASHSKLNVITVGDMQYAGDIAASEDTNQLYVLDLNPGNAVWKVDPASGQASKFITFTAKEQAVGISVHGGRILLTGKLFSKLFVYDANSGSSLSTVTLPNSLKLQHAVETASGTYYVSHYGAQGKDDVDGVSEFDSSGNSLRMYGGQRGSGDGQLKKPGHLALKPDGGVFVVDFENRRVVGNDSGLKSGTVLLTRDNFAGSRQSGDDGDLSSRPWRLAIDKKGNQLIVGTAKGDVKIYHL